MWGIDSYSYFLSQTFRSKDDRVEMSYLTNQKFIYLNLYSIEGLINIAEDLLEFDVIIPNFRGHDVVIHDGRSNRIGYALISRYNSNTISFESTYLAPSYNASLRVCWQPFIKL